MWEETTEGISRFQQKINQELRNKKKKKTQHVDEGTERKGEVYPWKEGEGDGN